ncbi:hypothetical protein JC525_16885 [Alteromonas sp. IB21]|uniref:hypothetical protein n=1 Tax=Alteromonas sp. IB21 TaxID=2779369 RepID=UPI0018E8BDE8|nr:hypothetical protein [Alteromonas sp. IB21]MBJ2130606.1 hypothetical protein [Alteromonas sp. IB21]
MDILSDDGAQIGDRLKSWQEMYDRPRFEQEVNPEDVEITRIISNYDMGEKGRCGLSTCKTPHNKGYLVLCKRKQGSILPIETNIGHVCGKNIFGHSFEEHEKAYKRDINTLRFRELITDHICKLTEYEEKLHHLKKEYGGVEAYASIRNFVDNHVLKASELTKLRRRAMTGQSEIVYVQKASEYEIEMEEVRLGRKLDDRERDRLTTSTTLGYIAGVKAVNDYTKIKRELVDEMPMLFKDLEPVEPELLTYPQLEVWSKRLNGLEARFNDVVAVIDECKRFSQPDNIDFVKTNSSLL